MTGEHIDLSVLNPETAEFWRGCNAQKLLLRRCAACGEAHYYPRTNCPFCFSSDTDWEEVDGNGTIYSFSIMRRASPQFALAYVTLSNGITMLTNIVDADLDTLEVGQAVELIFKPSGDGQLLPMFRPTVR